MKIGWKTCFKIGTTLLILFLLISYRSNIFDFLSTIFKAASPLFIGAAIAYVINILMSFYEKHYFPKAKSSKLIKSRRPVCLVASFATLVAIIVLVFALVIPQVISGIVVIVENMPDFLNKVITFLNEKNIPTQEISEYINNIDWKEKLTQVVQLAASGAGDIFDVVVGTVSSVFSGAVTIVIAFIFSFYLLATKEKLTGQFVSLTKRFIKPTITAKIEHILQVMNKCFKNYITGQCLEAVILGVLCTVGMLILRLPYATMIGPLIALTALIPIAGAYIGAATGVFMILTESPIKAVIFLVFIILLQQIEGNIIYPKVVGSSIGLPAIWVLAAVTIGGGVMGIPGMMLGVPLAATVYHLLKENKDASHITSEQVNK